MTLNDLSTRAVVLVIDELEATAEMGRTASAKHVDRAAAVQRAALGGKERGYDTRVVLDACNGLSERSEDAAVHSMNHAGIVLSSVPAVIGELAVDFADSRTQKLFGLFSQL